MNKIAYFPGAEPAPELLGRYLPPIPHGVAAQWLPAHVSPGDWVLDPFGVAPRLAVESARAGYRVLVAANNPVARFLLELAAHPPVQSELFAALAELAAAHKGAERLEPHIRSLYASECAHCGHALEVEAFLWEREAAAPYAKLAVCEGCGAAGEQPATSSDRQEAARFQSGGLHRARALARVAPPDDPDLHHVEEALAVYPPRAVYALFTLINRLDGLGQLQPRQRRNLTALLLAASEGASTLWPYPNVRERPRQLTIPPRYRENNVWRLLEASVTLWPVEPQPPVLITTWPETPAAAPGICLFEGRLKQLRAAVETRLEVTAALAALPRPNQAYWALSALWAGWLWGPEAAAPFKRVLRRRRYDWAWHTAALAASLEELVEFLPPGGPFLGLIGENEPGFLSAALVAGALSGLELEGLAQRTAHDQSQIHWRSPERGRPVTDPAAAGSQPGPSASEAGLFSPGGELIMGQAVHTLVLGARSCLQARSEPAVYIDLHAAALQALAPALTQLPQSENPANIYAQLSPAFSLAFSYQHGFLRFGGSQRSLEAGLWWFKSQPGQDSPNPDPVVPPLADRLERAAVNFLIQHSGCRFEELDLEMCRQFPGLLTPDPNLLRAVLTSYALPQENAAGEQAPKRWALRPEDHPAARRADLQSMHHALSVLGRRLEYQVEDFPARREVRWIEPGEGVRFHFHLVASAVWGRLLLGESKTPGLGVIVYPGGRAALAGVKIQADPRLERAAEDWRLLKFRHLRLLSSTPPPNRSAWLDQLAADPLDRQDPQMKLL